MAENEKARKRISATAQQIAGQNARIRANLGLGEPASTEQGESRDEARVDPGGRLVERLNYLAAVFAGDIDADVTDRWVAADLREAASALRSSSPPQQHGRWPSPCATRADAEPETNEPEAEA